MINDLTTGSVGKELLRFSFPFMLSNALQTVYNLVDMVVVGQFVGSAGLTAVSLGGQITWLLSCLAIGYASGGQIFISQLVGTRDHEGIRRPLARCLRPLRCSQFYLWCWALRSSPAAGALK